MFGAIVYPPPNPYFFAGQMDDIAIYDRKLKKEEILALFHARDPNYNRFQAISKQVLICLLAGLPLFLLGRWLLRIRIRKALKAEFEKNQLRNHAYEQENKVLKAQMDPHFIFNSL